MNKYSGNEVIGRYSELQNLQDLWNKKPASLVAFYGRRRVGKSYLLKAFSKSKKNLLFEALEHQATEKQIEWFLKQFSDQHKDFNLKNMAWADWSQAFDYLTEYLNQNKKNKIFIVFDEIPWMACGQTKLISLIKYYWDKYWKFLNVMIVMCGSVSSYMVKNVIKSKALYGRINAEFNLLKMKSFESKCFFKEKRSDFEILNYLLLFGGVPRYLEEINLHKSFDQNINQLCFSKDAFFVNEFDKIFFSHFKEARSYKIIAQVLAEKNCDLQQLAKKSKISSGGALKGYIENMKSAGFVGEYETADRRKKTNLRKYKLIDEYSRFYFKYIQPNKKSIQLLTKNNIFSEKVKIKWSQWLGFAFENFCIQNAEVIAGHIGFSDKIDYFGPVFHRGSEGFQFDLVFYRTDKVVTFCEIKYNLKPLGPQVISDMETRMKKISVPRGYSIEKALISVAGCEKSVVKSNYFDHILEVQDLFAELS